MNMKFLLILAALPLLALAVSKCYTYTNTQNHKPDTKTQGTCVGNTDYCVKYTTNFIAVDRSQDKIYSRDCGGSSVCRRDGCYDTDIGSVCCCSKNLCNSSTLTTGISSFVVLLSYFLFRS